jgi:hypothetical protein
MSHVSCPRCGPMSVVRATGLTVEHCPRARGVPYVGLRSPHRDSLSGGCMPVEPRANRTEAVERVISPPGPSCRRLLRGDHPRPRSITALSLIVLESQIACVLWAEGVRRRVPVG